MILTGQSTGTEKSMISGFGTTFKRHSCWTMVQWNVPYCVVVLPQISV